VTSIDTVDESSSLRQYASVLWRRRWMIALVTLVTVGIALAYCVVTTPVYQGTANLLLMQQLPSAVLQANNTFNPNVMVDVATDTQVLESADVTAIVKKTVPNAPSVNVTQVGTTNVVQVSTQSTDAALAAKAATAYANAYITYQHQLTANALNSAAQQVQNRLNTVQATANQISAELGDSTKASSPGAESSLASLQGSLQLEASSLQNQLANDQFYASSQTGESGQLISAATTPTKPVSPKTIEYSVLAAVLGLVLGIGLAISLEFFDDRVRTKEDVQRVAGSRLLLGLVPEIAEWRHPEASYLVTRAAPGSAPTEAFRTLRTSVQFLSVERAIRTLQFTSPGAPEGKTTTLANVAVVMAQAGMRVVMVDCDLRRPRLHEYFHLPNAVGFTSVLLKEATVGEALQPVAGLDSLHLMASGPIPPNPSELLAGSRAAELLRTVSEDADIVLIDSPPVLPLSDAAALAGKVDGVIIVTSSVTSSRNQLTRALERLDQVDAPVLGIVLNRSPEAEIMIRDASRSGSWARPQQAGTRPAPVTTSGVLTATPNVNGGGTPRAARGADHLADVGASETGERSTR